MLSKNNRFHGHRSLGFVYRRGKGVRNSIIGLKYAPNPRRTNHRFAIVISKKTVKSAVKRNTIRRRLYEIIRLEIPQMKGSFDVVLSVFNAEVYSLDNQSLSRQLNQLIFDAEMYK